MDEVRVVVAVSPRLLSDAVRRTLDLDGIATREVVVLPEQADVAIVTAGRETEVQARTVITLTDEASPGVEEANVRVRDLAGLRSALAGLLPRAGD